MIVNMGLCIFFFLPVVMYKLFYPQESGNKAGPIVWMHILITTYYPWCALWFWHAAVTSVQFCGPQWRENLRQFVTGKPWRGRDCQVSLGKFFPACYFKYFSIVYSDCYLPIWSSIKVEMLCIAIKKKCDREWVSRAEKLQDPSLLFLEMSSFEDYGLRGAVARDPGIVLLVVAVFPVFCPSTV